MPNNKKNVDRESVLRVINEQLSNMPMIKIGEKFSIKRSINDLVEKCADNSELLAILESYNSARHSKSDISLYESFINDLAPYADNENVSAVRKSLIENLSANQYDYVAISLYENVTEQLKDLVKVPLMSYLNEKSETARQELSSTLETLSVAGDIAISKLCSLVNEGCTTGMAYSPAMPAMIGALHESDDFAQKLNANKTMKVDESTLDIIYNAVNEQLVNNGAVAEEKEHGLAAMISSNGINLSESINSIRHNRFASTQNDLMQIVDRYDEALNMGAVEERLYETFIHHVSPYRSYISGIAGTLDDLKTRVESNKVNIDLTKILAEMSDTTSYFIVPIIEDDVERYVNNKTPGNRVQLINALAPFAGDPYVAQIIEIVNMDNDRRSVLGESKVISATDRLKFIKENAEITKIYSPIQYVKEGECIFNANGSFYVKNGPNISKLGISRIRELSENFIELCKLVNDPAVEINEKSITLYGDEGLKAEIFEKFVIIGEGKENSESLRNLNEMYAKYNSMDEKFFVMATCLHENFNRIADVDFAKHVEMRNETPLSVDIFRIGENISVAAHNNALNEHTFFKNINPIQCRTILNEHMGTNVSDLFEDLLPNQDRIIAQINEAQNEYEDSIKKYENALNRLKEAEKDSEGNDLKKIQDQIKSIEDRLADVKSEYKDWQEKANGMLNDAEEAKDTDSDDEKVRDEQEENEPLDAKEVEQHREEFLQPLNSDETSAVTDLESGDESLESDIDNVMSNSPMYNEEESNDSSDIEDIEPDFTFDEEAPSDDTLDNFDSEESADDESSMFDEDLNSDEDDSNDNESYKIVDVTFDQNIHSDTISRSGKAHVMIPSVNSDGDIVNDIKEYEFIIDENDYVVVNNDEDVALDIYNSIVDAVTSHENYESALKASPESSMKTSDEITAELDPEYDEFGLDSNDFFVDVPVDDETELDYGTESDDADTEVIDTEKESPAKIAPELPKVPAMKDPSGTEIELPAKNADPATIHESFLSIKPEVKKTKKTASKVVTLNEAVSDEEFDLEDDAEAETEITADDMFNMMHTVSENASIEAKDDDHEISVSDINSIELSLDESKDDEAVTVEFFTVEGNTLDEADEEEEISYVIYKIDEDLYQMPAEQFNEIVENEDLSGEEILDALKECEDCVASATPEDPESCIDLISTVFTSMTGSSYSIEEECQEIIDDLSGVNENFALSENVKIRKNNKLSAEWSSNNVKNDEAVNGTQQEQDNKESEEDAKDKKNECFKPTLPNQRKIDEYASNEKMFSVGAKVIFKPLNVKAQIHGVESDGTYDIVLLDGMTVSGVTKNQLAYQDEQALENPQKFNFDKDGLTRDLSLNPGAVHNDLNKRLDGNIIVDGFRMNYESCQVLMKDIFSDRTIHVINESGMEDLYPRENVQLEEVEASNWPWAVYTLALDEEPDRKIKVDPKSYLEAVDDEDLVNCLYNGELRQVEKGAIKILA